VRETQGKKIGITEGIQRSIFLTHRQRLSSLPLVNWRLRFNPSCLLWATT
jgi:hypothetical protein